jgi:hypothetical protein
MIKLVITEQKGRNQMSKYQAIKHYENKYNITLIYDQNEKTYAIYKNNSIYGYVYSLSDIDDYMAFKNK